MNHTVLQTKGLCKTYIVNKHQNNVLKNVDLTIGEGEMVAIAAHIVNAKPVHKRSAALLGLSAALPVLFRLYCRKNNIIK